MRQKIQHRRELPNDLPLFRQPPAIDPVRSAQNRDAGMTKAAAHAAPGFKDEAILAIERTARKLREFTSDDVWVELGEHTGTHDKRALGPFMLVAARRGIVTRSPKFITSGQTQNNGRPVRVWESKVYAQAATA